MAQGNALQWLGAGPIESAYEVIASGRSWRLRNYGGKGPETVFVVASPIKRPYIWDIAPQASVVRLCLESGYRVCLLEWIPPARAADDIGLLDYVKGISEGVGLLRSGRNMPFLAGHSLGGTLAALFAAWRPGCLNGLMLLGAPLCFGRGTSAFRDALVALVPPEIPGNEPIPGSLLSQWSALASPRSFIWSRLSDAGSSTTDLRVARLQRRIERWTLDEVPLPATLVRQILDWLYCEDRFCRGMLDLGGIRLGPCRLDIPTLAVVNRADEVVPKTSVQPFLASMPSSDVQLIEHPGESGVCLQHLGILVGRSAHARIWPQIIGWLTSHHRP